MYYNVLSLGVFSKLVISSDGIQNVSSVNGMWGPWESPQNCSSTCGGGVRIKSRQCNNPLPQAGGSYCKGLPYVLEICNTNECPGK